MAVCEDGSHLWMTKSQIEKRLPGHESKHKQPHANLISCMQVWQAEVPTYRFSFQYFQFPKHKQPHASLISCMQVWQAEVPT